jgi:hypothetical protein
MARKDDNAALAWTIGLGTVVLAGVGIYFYEKSQSQATTAPAATTPTVSLTPSQEATIAAGLFGTTVAAWQASGVPAADWAQLSPAAQQSLTALGIHANAT